MTDLPALRARVIRTRIDVTTPAELARGESSSVLGLGWLVSMNDGRLRAFPTWAEALDFAVRATTFDPFA